jgi:hypothetical protein
MDSYQKAPVMHHDGETRFGGIENFRSQSFVIVRVRKTCSQDK